MSGSNGDSKKARRVARRLTPEMKHAAKLYGQGLSARSSMVKVGSEKPQLDARDQLQNPPWLREALREARDTRVRFATLDRLARYKVVKHLADEATPAVVDAQLARMVFDVVRRGGDKSLAEAIADEDSAMSDLERAQRMLDETMQEDADAQRNAVDVESEMIGPVDDRPVAREMGEGSGIYETGDHVRPPDTDPDAEPDEQ